jgi:hypothetical protein
VAVNGSRQRRLQRQQHRESMRINGKDEARAFASDDTALERAERVNPPLL